MKKIDSFVLTAYIGPMVATFFIVLFILMMNGLWLYIDDIVGKGLPLSAVFELIFYYSSTMIPLGLPLATLLAALMTLGNMGENYELTALKAAGISLTRIIRSILILAFIISIASFFVINNYVPYSVNKMGKVLSSISSLRQQIEFTDGVFFNGIPNISIRVEKQDEKSKMLYGVLIYDNRDKEMSNTIISDSGRISLTPDKEYMKIDLYHGQNLEDNRNHTWLNVPKLRTNFFTYQVLTIPLEGFSFAEGDKNMYEGRSNTKNIGELQYDIDSLSLKADEDIFSFQRDFLKSHLYRKDTSILMRNVKDTLLIKEFKNRKKYSISSSTIDTLSIRHKNRIYENAVSNLLNLSYFASSGHSSVASSTITLYRSKADWHKKLSLPVSVFVFFLIGAPLGAIIRKGGLGLPVMVCILFFLIYYILNMMGEKFVKEGAMLPVIGMWLSTIVLAPIAIFLTIKSTKDSQLLNIEVYINMYKRVKIYINKKLEKNKK